MINVVVVGTGGSGKSSLCIRFVSGNWVERYDPTIEDTYRKQIESNGRSVMVEITDTAGQEQYEECVQMSLGLASCVLVAVASDNEQSLAKAHGFIEMARQARSPSLSVGATHPPIVVVRTKSDRPRWLVTDEQLVELCRRYELSTNFLVTSAKLNRGVNEAFDEAIRLAQAYVERAYALESSRSTRRTSSILHLNGNGARSRRASLTSSLVNGNTSALGMGSTPTLRPVATINDIDACDSAMSVRSTPNLHGGMSNGNGNGGGCVIL